MYSGNAPLRVSQNTSRKKHFVVKTRYDEPEVILKVEDICLGWSCDYLIAESGED
jgi:hypothetical protein